MKFTLSWLKDHLETDAPLETILDTLTMIGLEVESVDDKASLKPFVIARVVEAEQHPNADKLKVLKVDTGSGDPVQVVCGASNARAGLLGAFAAPGTYVPGIDVTLSVGNIRGVESHGMMCSERELMISDDHEGIIELSEDAPVGTSYAAWAGMNDPVIEIGLTPNRPDCTGIYGIARDLAAAGIGKLRSGVVEPVAGQGECPVNVTIKAPDLCPGFALRLVRGVRNGPSPKWLQQRLIAIGLRPINALVDITNYLTFDRARPLHVFDLAKVKGNLVVRRGRLIESWEETIISRQQFEEFSSDPSIRVELTSPWRQENGFPDDLADARLLRREPEYLSALNGHTYPVTEEMCVIADDNGVESISGIMGGEHSGCDENTTDVLIESALWNPANIARTGRDLGIITDARYRFERGIDPAFMEPGLELATRMVLDLCGGTATGSVVKGYVEPERKIVEFPVAEVRRLTGIEVAAEECMAILTRLGFEPQGTGDRVPVKVPTWRPDIDGKADLVEEVMRINGVNNIAPQPLESHGTVNGRILTPLQIKTRLARRTLAARGMMEAVTWSFIPHAHAKVFGGGTPALQLANPIAADMSDMRPSLLPGLLSAAARNAARGYGDVALFEVSGTYEGDTPDRQRRVAAGLRRGTATLSGGGRHWDGAARQVGVFDAKADAIAALEACGAPVDRLTFETGAPDWYHPGRSGVIKLGPKTVLGHFGEFHPSTLEALDVTGALAGFEIFIDAIPEGKKKATRTKPALSLSSFQALRRDFAFVVDRDIAAADIVRAAAGADKVLVQAVSVFDLFEGASLGEDRKSVAIEVVIQPRERTLTDEDLEKLAAAIVANVAKATGGVLRG